MESDDTDVTLIDVDEMVCVTTSQLVGTAGDDDGCDEDDVANWRLDVVYARSLDLYSSLNMLCGWAWWALYTDAIPITTARSNLEDSAVEHD